MGADTDGAARGEALRKLHFGNNTRTGFLRGALQQAVDVVADYRDAGCERFIIGLRQGPYDWEALYAFAEKILRLFATK